MVIGNGLMANGFKKSFLNNNEIIIFASGVSNSKNISLQKFEREIKLVNEHINSCSIFVYFSTTSIYNKNLKESPYVKHKLKVEDLIIKKCKNYLIIRTSNIVSNKGNRLNVINYFFDNIKNKIEFNLWEKAYRNIIDIDDFVLIVNNIINNYSSNKIVDVCNVKDISILEIISQIEKYLNKKAIYILQNKGGKESKKLLSISDIPPNILLKMKKDDYFYNLLLKYYVDQ